MNRQLQSEVGEGKGLIWLAFLLALPAGFALAAVTAGPLLGVAPAGPLWFAVLGIALGVASIRVAGHQRPVAASIVSSIIGVGAGFVVYWLLYAIMSAIVVEA